MINGIEKINQVIEYIEENITEDIDCKVLSKIATLSEYEFRRIFSFIIGIPVAEYIRKRRLSIAGELIKTDKESISTIALKFGYESASSFTRSFKETFGVTPQEAKDSAVKLSIYTKPRFNISISGGVEIFYTEKEDKTFYINGISGESLLTDTCCCESVWKEYEKLNLETDGTLYAAYENGDKNVICHIGQRLDDKGTGQNFLIKEGKWLVFNVKNNATEKEINNLYEKIIFDFIPSSVYVRDQSRPNVEEFLSDGAFNILIPVK